MKTDGWKKELIKAFLTIKKEEDFSRFLDGMFTPQEIIELSRRLQIIKLLKKGVPQHEIASKLGVGVATVTRGSKEIQKGNFKDYYDITK